MTNKNNQLTIIPSTILSEYANTAITVKAIMVGNMTIQNISGGYHGG